MTYTTEETVWIELANRLRTAASLSYVKKVLEGDRQVGINSDRPCIILEPELSEEEWAEFPLLRQNKMIIIIRGVLDVRNHLDSQIIGDTQQVGIFRFENDIKKAFEGSDLQFAGNVYNYRLRTTNTRIIDNSDREVTIRLELEFKYFTAGQRI
jgi:hypothetical protein